MPTLSLYALSRGSVELGGPFYEKHVSLGTDVFGQAEIDNVPGNSSMLAITRWDQEDVIDLADMYNNLSVPGMPPLFTNQPDPITLQALVAGYLATWPNGGSSLRYPQQGLRSAPLNRQTVPAWLTIPPDTGDQLTTELHIDFHINTPWNCQAHEGTFTAYVQFQLLNGSLSAVVIAETYTPDADPSCGNEVNNTINGKLSEIQAVLDAYLGKAVPTALQTAIGQNPPAGIWEGRHGRIYGLPGDGKRSGEGSGNADLDFSIGLERSGVIPQSVLTTAVQP